MDIQKQNEFLEYIVDRRPFNGILLKKGQLKDFYW